MSNTKKNASDGRSNVSFKVPPPVEFAIDDLELFGKRIGLAQEGESKRSFRRMNKASMISAVMLWLYDQPEGFRKGVLTKGIELLNTLPADATEPRPRGSVEHVVLPESPPASRKKPGDGKEKTG